MKPFYTILTNYGKTALAEAIAAQQPLKIPYMAVGDGGGEYYEPTEGQTNLRNERWRGDLNDLRTDDELQGQVIAEAIIPHDIKDGDWTAREIGLFDANEKLVAVGKYPETYIPSAFSGVKQQVYINIIVKVDNVAAVELIIDHTTILASKLFVQQADEKLRSDFASEAGAEMVHTSSGNSVQQEIDTLQDSARENSLQLRQGIPLSDRRLILNAHRGYSETYLEQTLLAFSQCDAEALEVDMQTTKDGFAVCFHDDDLSIQTINGMGGIKDNDIATIELLRFKRASGTRYSDMVGIPRLGVVCKMAARRGKKLLAEIKGYRTIEDCIQYNSIISSYGLATTTTYICFDFAPLELIREINKVSSFGWVINSYNSAMDNQIAKLASWGGSVLSIKMSALSSIGYGQLRLWESMGLTIQVWTVYTMQQLQEVLDYGVRNITLDKDFASTLNS